jgi:hypothetical protein
VVASDYRTDPLLHAVERAFDGSAAFRHVLTPGNDRRSHRDHFHFEARTLGDPGAPDPSADGEYPPPRIPSDGKTALDGGPRRETE